MTARPRIRWAEVPEVVIPTIKCPYCTTVKPVTVKSTANGDGSRTRLCVCCRCSKAFKVIIETDDF